MGTISTIVIRARKAIADKGDMEIRVSDWIEAVHFHFMSGETVDGFENWFSKCRSLSLKDVKMSKLEEHTEVPPFGEGPEDGEYIVCIWKDAEPTCFELRQAWSGEKCTMDFYEKPFVGNLEELYDIPDNRQEFLDSLIEIRELAKKINANEFFTSKFEVMIALLKGEQKGGFDNAPYFVKELPDNMKDLLLAKRLTNIFGGMGFWNDEPYGESELMGIKDEFERITQRLIRNKRMAQFYVTNECWKADE
ncbi:MAG: hypothetical protein K6A90_07185 [Lachnospiraceae bacterium]|nr:hypothetical protein [Lachnospiraceae bacterium]